MISIVLRPLLVVSPLPYPRIAPRPASVRSDELRRRDPIETKLE